jgi:hypothetical protein
LGFHTVTDDVKVAAETFECTGMVTVTGAGAFESTTDRNDTHGEVTTAGIWHTFEHILYFAAAVSGTIGGKVYFEVAYRFKGDTQLKIFKGIAAGRADNGVAADEPVVLQGTVDIVVSGETECKVHSRSKEASVFLLTEHVTDFRTETGKGHGIRIFVGKAEIAYAHGNAGSMLAEFIPPTIFWIGTGDYSELYACRVLRINT